MPDSKQHFQITVNGQLYEVEAEPEQPLLHVLREDLNLLAPKYGCGLGQCGSCQVLLDDRSVSSCILPVRAVGNRKITTLEGVRNEQEDWHPVQQAFIDHHAAQCGYCTNGLIISSIALLKSNPNPSETEIRNALQVHLCRCGTHPRVLQAIRKLAKPKPQTQDP